MENSDSKTKTSKTLQFIGEVIITFLWLTVLVLAEFDFWWWAISSVKGA